MFTHENENLVGYLDGGLRPEARVRVERHLAACAACRSALAELRAARSVLEMAGQGAPVPAHDAELWTRVRAQIAPHPAPRPVSRLRPRWALATGAFALTATAATVVLLVNPPASKQTVARHEPTLTVTAEPNAAAPEDRFAAPAPPSPEAETAPKPGTTAFRAGSPSAPARPGPALPVRPIIAGKPDTAARPRTPIAFAPREDAPAAAPRKPRLVASLEDATGRPDRLSFELKPGDTPAWDAREAPTGSAATEPMVPATTATGRAGGYVMGGPLAKGQAESTARPDATSAQDATLAPPPASPAAAPVHREIKERMAGKPESGNAEKAVTTLYTERLKDRATAPAVPGPSTGPDTEYYATRAAVPDALDIVAVPPLQEIELGIGLGGAQQPRVSRDAPPAPLGRLAASVVPPARKVGDEVRYARPATEEGRRLFAEATAAQSRGRTQESTWNFRKALAAGIALTEARIAHLRLGDAAVQTKDDAIALKEYTAAIEIAKDAEVLAKLGGVYERLGDIPKATNAYEQALMFQPGHSQARAGLTRLKAKK